MLFLYSGIKAREIAEKIAGGFLWKAD